MLGTARESATLLGNLAPSLRLALARALLGGNTGLLRVVVLVQEHSLGACMSCTIMLDNISGSESAIFDHIIHYFDGYFAHFFRTKFGDLF